MYMNVVNKKEINLHSYTKYVGVNRKALLEITVTAKKNIQTFTRMIVS